MSCGAGRSAWISSDYLNATPEGLYPVNRQIESAYLPKRQ